MNKNSFIYSNIQYYRFLMSLLYKGNYYKRFKAIVTHISGKSVTEICFADTVIADYCEKNAIAWKGIDINGIFVSNALKKGFKAEQRDIRKIPVFSPADTCIIAGSLYHFHADREELFKKMLNCAPVIIISEPVINLSQINGIIGKLAKRSAAVNGKEQSFRYTEKTLTETLKVLSEKLNFNFRIVEQFSKDLIIVITK